MAAQPICASPERRQVCSAPSPQSQSTYDSLTFGIELEFLVLSPPGCFAHLPPLARGRWTALTFIYQGLVAKGIPAKIGIMPISSNPEGGKYTCWNVHHDNTLRLTDEEAAHLPDGYNINPLELASRVLSLSADNWQAEIAAVLETIQSLRQLGCLIITNQHCGLHVHVGFGMQMVPVETCKTVLQVATAMERCFDRLHTTSRIVPGEGLNFNVNKHFNAPLSWFHQKNFEGIAETSVFHWLGAIEKCEDHEDLQDLFMYVVRGFRFNCSTNGHNSTVNFDNCSDILDDESEDTGTIEFRQHEVLFCHDSSDLSVVKICSRAWDLEYGVEDAMRDIGCSDALVTYYRAKLSMAEHSRQRHLVDQLEFALNSGRVEGIPALEIENALNRFQRGNTLAVSCASGDKLAKGSYGKLMSFDNDKNQAMEAAFHSHAAVLESGRSSNLTAKGVAFRYMSGKTCFWLE